MMNTIAHLYIIADSLGGAVPFLAPTPLNEKRATRVETLIALSQLKLSPVTKRRLGACMMYD